MSDLLERVAGPGLDLLRRADDALVAVGAPAGDPVWALLREVRALPADIVEQLLAADGTAFLVAGDELTAGAREVGVAADSIPGVARWSGHAADAYAARWSAALTQVDRIAERLSAGADYAQALAGWVAQTRRAVAVAVAECLASPEAATVRLAGPAPDAATGAAAASIVAHVLAAVAEAIRAGQALHDQWSGRLDELGPPVVQPVTGSGAPTTIQL